MTFEADAAAATDDIIDALGQAVDYCLKGGGAIVSITGVFDRRPFFVELDDGQAQQFSARLSAKTSDLPVGHGVGDSVTVGSVEYTVHTMELDNLGETEMLLSKV